MNMASQTYNPSFNQGYNKPLPRVSPQQQHHQLQHQYQPQQHQQQYQQSGQYNHQSQYQQGSPGEQQRQQKQYQQYQQVQQQYQQQQDNGQRRTSGGQQTAAVQNSLQAWFDAVDTDHSGTLSCEELQRALMNGDWTPFNVETVRLMMNMFDRDNDGTISFNEFIGLWNYIEKWKQCFQAYDLDGSGTIDTMELQKALQGFGYNLSEAIVQLIVTKYDVRGQGDISFDNFVQSCVTIQTLTSAFRRIDVAGTGVVTMTYEQFLGLVINNR
ncbi:Alpha-1 3/1 6-mannosyltransferase alg-2 [Linnemannia exigua]|uniref:Alpha-1 3/1 6-mannosyltransferase alg-2 n=1 Tax=Linnemannia exigua TaxID=604196 RepID=A0AAD4D7T0_9FUNG|nr:Alpha-1 3/1 6-mannosyltransferase alg-2 [Linnemannia exigua]